MHRLPVKACVFVYASGSSEEERSAVSLNGPLQVVEDEPAAAAVAARGYEKKHDDDNYRKNKKSVAGKHTMRNRNNNASNYRLINILDGLQVKVPLQASRYSTVKQGVRYTIKLDKLTGQVLNLKQRRLRAHQRRELQT